MEWVGLEGGGSYDHADCLQQQQAAAALVCYASCSGLLSRWRSVSLHDRSLSVCFNSDLLSFLHSGLLHFSQHVELRRISTGDTVIPPHLFPPSSCSWHPADSRQATSGWLVQLVARAHLSTTLLTTSAVR